ncbi:unnamed protein product [Lathyrus sativus]|nr:unnamed protein product [Lathyrus sativus]
MDSHDSVTDFETKEHIGSAPPASNNVDLCPQKHKKRPKALNPFTPMPPNTKKSKSAKCNRFFSLIKYNGGTRAVLAHLRRCSNNPDNGM